MKEAKEKAKKHPLGKRIVMGMKKGMKDVMLFYTREVNGKKVPNYKRLGITAGILAGIGAGVYVFRKKMYVTDPKTGKKKFMYVIQKRK